MKIVLTHAYFLNQDLRERAIMKPYPPLGLLYISSWLDKHGYDNAVYDSTFSDPSVQRRYLLDVHPEIIAIYVNLMSKVRLAELVSWIRSELAFNNTLIVLGGPDITYNIESYLNLGADVVVIGEGEQTMLDLVKAYGNRSTDLFDKIEGIAYKDHNSKIIRTPARPKMPDLDVLPLPNRRKIDMSLYLDAWRKYHGKSAISISTQRGCPYTCKWCSTAVYGQSYRRRSPAAVAEEMEMVHKEYMPDQLWFVDDVFTISHKWLKEFQVELHRRNIHLPFECITRADRLTTDVLKVLKDAGCFRVWIGAESGSQKILDAMDRRVDVLQVEEMIIKSREIGIETGTFIMLGYPGETEKDIHLTLNYLKRANPDLFTITVAYPIKGTSLFSETESSHIQKGSWVASTDRDIDFKRTYPRSYYNFAVRWIVNSMNLHKSYLSGNTPGLRSMKIWLKILMARCGMYMTKSKLLKSPNHVNS